MELSPFEARVSRPSELHPLLPQPDIRLRGWAAPRVRQFPMAKGNFQGRMELEEIPRVWGMGVKGPEDAEVFAEAPASTTEERARWPRRPVARAWMAGVSSYHL